MFDYNPLKWTIWFFCTRILIALTDQPDRYTSIWLRQTPFVNLKIGVYLRKILEEGYSIRNKTLESKAIKHRPLEFPHALAGEVILEEVQRKLAGQ